MNELNFLDNEHFARISIHSLVDFTSHALTNNLALHPLDDLALGLDSRFLLFDKVILESLLYEHSLLEHLLVAVQLLQSLWLVIIGQFG